MELKGFNQFLPTLLRNTIDNLLNFLIIEERYKIFKEEVSHSKI